MQGDGLLRRAEMVGPPGLDLDERDDAVGRHHDDVELPVPRMPVAPQNRVSVPFQPIRRILLPQHPQLLGFERAVAQPAQHIAQPRHGRIMIGRSACVFRSACQTGVHDHQCTIKPPSTTWFSANVVEGSPASIDPHRLPLTVARNSSACRTVRHTTSYHRALWITIPQ